VVVVQGVANTEGPFAAKTYPNTREEAVPEYRSIHAWGLQEEEEWGVTRPYKQLRCNEPWERKKGKTRAL